MTVTQTKSKTYETAASLTIRRAEPRDERRLIRLAGRDSSPRPTGQVLVAELGGELVAARSLTDGHAIADPFRPTAAIAELIALRTAPQVGAGAAAKRRRRHQSFSSHYAVCLSRP